MSVQPSPSSHVWASEPRQLNTAAREQRLAPQRRDLAGVLQFAEVSLRLRVPALPLKQALVIGRLPSSRSHDAVSSLVSGSACSSDAIFRLRFTRASSTVASSSVDGRSFDQEAGGQSDRDRPIVGKSHRARRLVPLTAKAMEAIAALPPRVDTALLFPASEAAIWGSRTRARAPGIRRLKRPGISKRGPYHLRHTFATEALAAGVSTFELSRVMGTSIQMIDQHYGHLARDSEDSIRARLDAGIRHSIWRRTPTAAIAVQAAIPHGGEDRGRSGRWGSNPRPSAWEANTSTPTLRDDRRRTPASMRLSGDPRLRRPHGCVTRFRIVLATNWPRRGPAPRYAGVRIAAPIGLGGCE